LRNGTSAAKEGDDTNYQIQGLSSHPEQNVEDGMSGSHEPAMAYPIESIFEAISAEMANISVPTGWSWASSIRSIQSSDTRPKSWLTFGFRCNKIICSRNRSNCLTVQCLDVRLCQRFRNTVPERGELLPVKQALPVLSKAGCPPVTKLCQNHLFAIMGVSFEREAAPQIAENTEKPK
jgi:hypothetical protein